MSDKSTEELLDMLGEAVSEASSQPPAEGKESLTEYLERLADEEDADGAEDADNA